MKLSAAFQEASIDHDRNSRPYVTFPLLVCRTFSPIFFHPSFVGCGERREPGYFAAGERNWYSTPRIRLHRLDSIDDTSKYTNTYCGLGNDHVVSTIDAMRLTFSFSFFFFFFFSDEISTGRIRLNRAAARGQNSWFRRVEWRAPDKWI